MISKGGQIWRGVPDTANEEGSAVEDVFGRDYQYVWVERAERGPLGDRQWDMVSRVNGREAAEQIKRALEATGRRVQVRENNARYPGT